MIPTGHPRVDALLREVESLACDCVTLESPMVRGGDGGGHGSGKRDGFDPGHVQMPAAFMRRVEDALGVCKRDLKRLRDDARPRADKSTSAESMGGIVVPEYESRLVRAVAKLEGDGGAGKDWRPTLVDEHGAPKRPPTRGKTPRTRGAYRGPLTAKMESVIQDGAT